MRGSLCSRFADGPAWFGQGQPGDSRAIPLTAIVGEGIHTKAAPEAPQDPPRPEGKLASALRASPAGILRNGARIVQQAEGNQIGPYTIHPWRGTAAGKDRQRIGPERGIELEHDRSQLRLQRHITSRNLASFSAQFWRRFSRVMTCEVLGQNRKPTGVTAFQAPANLAVGVPG